MEKKDIKNLTFSELTLAITKMGEKNYRAKQLFGWLYQKGVGDFDQMPNISKLLKDKLKEKFYIGAIECVKHVKSKESAEKFIFKLKDKNLIETVLILSRKRNTLCLSTQVGCRFRCAFCASGMRGFVRNLTPSEIVDQILSIQSLFKHRLTNFVFMGMGEPLDNCDNLLKAIKIMNDPLGMGIGARRITVSTSGIIPGIYKLIELGMEVNLSISLHAGNNKLRSELIPLNRRYPLDELIKVCRRYREATGRIITLEYILIKNKNCSIEDADEVAAITRGLGAKVNAIRCSSVPGLSFSAPRKEEEEAFMERLIEKGVNVILRQSKGSDIFAACGQLSGDMKV